MVSDRFQHRPGNYLQLAIRLRHSGIERPLRLGLCVCGVMKGKRWQRADQQMLTKALRVGHAAQGAGV